jgi:hypothetical protein
MNNKNLLTYNSKVTQVEQAYYAPVATLPPPISLPISTIYCFLSRIDPWTAENDPVQPTNDQRYLKTVFKNIFVAKQITSNQISPVVQRIDWTSGNVYDYYQDDIDMFELDGDGLLVKQFYVRNRYDQVFKCLWNNTGGESTNEPFFQPGTYNSNNIYIGADGYKWKYIYTIDIGIKTRFMDTTWIPVPVGNNTPGPVFDANGNQIGIWAGNIDVINVIDGGSGYDPANSSISVVITGDGTGAAADVEVTDGQITNIIVNNPGSNYSYADVSITSASGSGVLVTAPVSPLGGHGFDPVSELGCSKVMFTAEFNGDENGYIPVDIDYRQVGLLINPTTLSSWPVPAQETIYKVTTDLVVASGFGVYTNDEIVYQGETLENSTFSAHVVSFDAASNVVKLINITGTLSLNAPVFGNSSKTVRTLLNYSTPDFLPFSGYISYIENREAVQRSADGIEQFKFVLGY